MDFNEYVAEVIAAQRLAELRERGARLALVDAGRSARAGLSRRLGAALIRMGHWLLQGQATRTRNAGVRLAR